MPESEHGRDEDDRDDGRDFPPSGDGVAANREWLRGRVGVAAGCHGFADASIGPLVSTFHRHPYGRVRPDPLGVSEMDRGVSLSRSTI